MIDETQLLLEDAVRRATSFTEVVRLLGRKPVGGSIKHVADTIRKRGLDTSHFTHRSNLSPPNRRTPEEVLRYRHGRREPGERLRKTLLETGVEYVCVMCRNTGAWNGSPLTLEVDHINCDPFDNGAHNLRFLCPNCHAQVTAEALRARRKPPRCCPRCLGPISKIAISCATCRYADGNRGETHRRPTKIVWPSDDELLAMLEKSNYSEVGRRLGVSDNAIRKRLRRNN